MKCEDYMKIEDNLTSVLGLLDDINSSVDTSEDKEWNKKFNRVFDNIKYLKEELIFTFRIEDD